MNGRKFKEIKNENETALFCEALFPLVPFAVDFAGSQRHKH